jgi:hypothetical protein
MIRTNNLSKRTTKVVKVVKRKEKIGEIKEGIEKNTQK